ncbi:MAG: oligosaccharide flippase family protein, partial [Acinetobacter sp.]|nr:oligosaccharide flippase family protein [Acinetobacter sp.]
MKSLSDKINAKLDAQGGFLKAVSILVGGTVFAQGIAVISLPILTRIYSPKDFSLFAVYASLLMILSVASCLRFEIAIPIPKEDSEATDLILLALISNFFISILIGLIIWLFHTDIIMLLNQPDFSKLIWLVPIGVFFAGIYNALQYWATRKKNFNLIAKTRVVQSVSGVSIQIIMGITGFLTIGLIIGQIVKVSAGIRRLANNFWYDSFQYVKNIEFKKLKDTFKGNDQFPKYSTFEALANTASIQLPVIIIAALSIGSEAGYLMLAMQIMAIPMKLIGGAVSQVYLANAQDEIQKGTIKGYTVSLLENLIKYGVSTLILIGVISP